MVVKLFLAGVSQGRQNLRCKNGKDANNGDKDVAASKDARKEWTRTSRDKNKDVQQLGKDAKSGTWTFQRQRRQGRPTRNMDVPLNSTGKDAYSGTRMFQS